MATAPSWPRVLLRSEDSGNYLSVIETAPGPGVGPPLHAHGFDETFYAWRASSSSGCVTTTSR
jgi:hypothetical protein